MKFYRVFTAIVLVLLSVHGLAFSADAPPVLPTDRPVTLQECIDYALTQHASVQVAKQGLNSSRAEITRARSSFMPQITANTSFLHNGTQSQPGTGNTSTFTGTENTIGVSETFYDGGRTHAAVRQANASARAASADVDLAMQNRTIAVTTAYFDALLTKRLAEIAAQTVTESEEQLKLIQARIESGDAANVDVYPVDVQLANAKLARLQSDNSARVSATSLRNAVGLDRGPELKLVDVSEPATDMTVLDDSIKSAMENRPEIVRSVSTLESAKAALNLAKLQAIPIPTMSAGFGRNLGGADYHQKWSFGVGVSMNIYNGGASKADIQIAKARLESAELDDGQLRKDISTEVEAAYLNWTNALERLASSKSTVTLAQTNLAVAREKYQQGLAIPLEIVSAQRSYADAQANYAQTLYDCYIARAQLLKTMGKRG